LPPFFPLLPPLPFSRFAPSFPPFPPSFPPFPPLLPPFFPPFYRILIANSAYTPYTPYTLLPTRAYTPYTQHVPPLSLETSAT